MTLFWKTVAAVILTLILAITVGKGEKDLSVLLTMAACTAASVAALHYLSPVLELLKELEHIGSVETGMLRTLLNTAGIAMISEILEMLCSDAGNAALGKILQFLSSAAILYLTIPVFQSFLSLIRDILGAI